MGRGTINISSRLCTAPVSIPPTGNGTFSVEPNIITIATAIVRLEYTHKYSEIYYTSSAPNATLQYHSLEITGIKYLFAP